MKQEQKKRVRKRPIEILMQRPVHVVPNPVFQVAKLQKIAPLLQGAKKRRRRPKKKDIKNAF